MARTYDVTDLIPFGYENAISRRDLVKKAIESQLVESSNYSADRQVRKLMQVAKERGTVILYRTDGGYYQPTNEDERHLRHYIARTRQMAYTLMNESRYAERLLTDIVNGYKVGESE